MSSYAATQRIPAGRARPLELRFVPAALIAGATVFNAVLAVVNGHVMPLTPAWAVAAELAVVAAAHGVALANYRPAMLPWYALIASLLLIACYRGIALEQFEPKYLRDVLLIPTFVVLGMTFDARNLTRLVVVIHAVVLVVLVLEAIAPSAYSALFRVQDYYINTRGYNVEDFWNKESDLYVSAVRPDARLFSFIDLHRLSSIFLEPVSLGNYCIVIMSFVVARYRQLGTATRLFLVSGTLIALIGCDGRLAAVASVIIVVAALMTPMLPPYISVLYLPGVMAAASLLVALAGLHAGADDFAGRIAHTVELLGRLGPAELLGITDDRVLLSQAVDSGIAYLILTQSIVGVVLVWIFIALGSAEHTRDQARFKQAVCIYLPLTMLVSFSFLSIKTAALMWFVHGVLQNQQRDELARHHSGTAS